MERLRSARDMAREKLTQVKVGGCNTPCCIKTRSYCGKAMTFLKSHSENVLLVLLIVFMLIGILIGLLVRGVEPKLSPSEVIYLGFPGDLLMRMLKMMILPLIMSSLISGLANLDLGSSGRMGGRAVLYYMTTTLLAVVLGIILVAAIKPGSYNTKNSLTETKGAPDLVRTSDKILDLVRGVFPDNLVTSTFQQTETTYSFYNCSLENPDRKKICNDTTKIEYLVKKNIISGEEQELWFTIHVNQKGGLNILGLLVFSIAFGLVLGGMKEKGRPLVDFFDCLSVASMKIVNMIIWYSPIGVCFLIAAKLVAIPDLQAMLIRLGYYMLTVLVGLAVHGLIVLPLIYFIFTRKNPLKFIKGIIQALVTAFATSSSSATMPVTMKCLEENNHLDKRVVSFVIPVGATINMDGTALYEAVAAIFIAQINNWDMTAGNYITTSITATIASIGAAGVPSAGLITLIIVVNAIGLPDEDIAYILAIDWFLDRFRTMINVLGDCLGSGIINHFSIDELTAHDHEMEEMEDGQSNEAGETSSITKANGNGVHNETYTGSSEDTHM